MNTDYGIIGTIIGLIALICFFVMAWRLGKLQKDAYRIGARITNKPFYDAQTAEILGKKEEAIEKYIAVLYLVSMTGYTVTKYNKKQSTEFLDERIHRLGGKIPDLLKEKNQFISRVIK
jgi:hypothetical protein